MQNQRVQIDTLDSALQQSGAVARQGIIKLDVGVTVSNRTYGAGYGHSW